MSFYNHRKKSKPEIEAARKRIRETLAGKPLPKPPRITGIWIYEPNTKTYRSGDQVLTAEQYEMMTAEDDAAETVTGMAIDSHRIVMMPAPGCLPIGTNPDEHIAKTEPTKAIQPDPADKDHPWYEWSRKRKQRKREAAQTAEQEAERKALENEQRKAESFPLSHAACGSDSTGLEDIQGRYAAASFSDYCTTNSISFKIG